MNLYSVEFSNSLKNGTIHIVEIIAYSKYNATDSLSTNELLEIKSTGILKYGTYYAVIDISFNKRLDYYYSLIYDELLPILRETKLKELSDDL